MGEIETIADQMANPGVAFAIVGVGLLVATFASLAGFITRKMVTFAVIVALTLAVIYFHEHLPLPTGLHQQIDDVRRAIFR